MISEACLTEYKSWVGGTYWITPEMLYNDTINSNIAIWYLYHLDSRYFRNYQDKFQAVISAYSGGPTRTMTGWRDYEYLRRLFLAIQDVKP